MKNFFSTNLIFLRKQKGLTQEKVATALGLKRNTYANYESEHSQPDILTLLNIASNFGISVDDFLKTDLSQVRFEQGKTIPKNAKKGEVLGEVSGEVLPILEPKNTIITIAGDAENNHGNRIIPITDIKVAAGSGIYAPEYLENVDNIAFPPHLLRKQGTYLCVRVKGASMAPTLQDDSYMIIRLLERTEWAGVSRNQERIYVVVDGDSKGSLKRVKNRLDNGFVVCMSDNPDKATYPNFNLQIDEITSIWEAVWYISARMPNIHDQYYSKVQKLEDNIEDLKATVNKIIKRLPAS